MSWRQDAVDRLDAMSGLHPTTGVTGINREPVAWWSMKPGRWVLVDEAKDQWRFFAETSFVRNGEPPEKIVTAKNG